ncbi:hypothetical protein F3Y22_tig00110627pilonHSYRG00094 [Hibiscus syriacus]|uniref:Retroviral polymerase SH3-like domain-containing protein n=1 Tax=Hibiscus syriacus TaxID=106335 RepID=A0A6A2ZYZ8_HIBSY|nr:hypothetical protein F3Y22_tig00110627pilonHSYRG00094 [Hibiscus syriacus]
MAVVNIVNLTSLVPLNGGILEEVWTGKRASYNHLKVFACRAFVHIPKDERAKFDAKTKECIYLRSPKDEFDYQLWGPVNKKVVRSRDVVFFEDQTIKDIKNSERPRLRSSKNTEPTLVRIMKQSISFYLNRSGSCYTRTLHVYKHGPQASKVIREALSKALVPYYPLDRRLKESGDNQLHVECSSEGAWFVEASANCTLDAFDYFDNASFSIPYDELLPDQVPKSEGMEPLVQMQVTQFSCGGFVIGLIFYHTICDGLGSTQFLNAVGVLARGVKYLSVAPVWQRDFFPISKQQANVDQLANLPIPPPMPGNPLEHVSIDISLDEINQLKKQFHESTWKNCSAFEIVAANFWRLRTKAINFKPGTKIRLLFFSNCRQLTDPPLPKSFYDNCFFPITIVAPCDVFKQSSAIDVIKLIQEARLSYLWSIPNSRMGIT